MVIYFGADHRGFELKERLKGFVKTLGYEVFDVGAPAIVPDDDYPDYAKRVADQVAPDPAVARGILLCGGGTGMAVAADKVRGIRSVLGVSPDQVFAARHDDDVNILSISTNFTTPEAAEQMAKIFLLTPFGGDERYKRRIDKITAIENANA